MHRCGLRRVARCRAATRRRRRCCSRSDHRWQCRGTAVSQSVVGDAVGQLIGGDRFDGWRVDRVGQRRRGGGSAVEADQPAQDIADVCCEGLGGAAAGQLDVGMRAPHAVRRSRRGQTVHDPVGAVGCSTGAGGPGDDAAGLPRQLQRRRFGQRRRCIGCIASALTIAFAVGRLGAVGRRGGVEAGEALVGVGKVAEIGLEVSHHLTPHWSRQPPRRRQRVLGLFEQVEQHPLPAVGIGAQRCDLCRCTCSLRLGPDQARNRRPLHCRQRRTDRSVARRGQPHRSAGAVGGTVADRASVDRAAASSAIAAAVVGAADCGRSVFEHQRAVVRMACHGVFVAHRFGDVGRRLA